jgi:hypothetical protein
MRFIILMLLSSVAWAQSNSLNLNLPTAPQTYQQDRIRAGDLDCSNAIGSSTNLEFGVVGIIEDTNPYEFNQYNQTYKNKDVGVYARITIPLDGPAERINCNTLYQLELDKKRLEIMRLQAEVQALRNLQFTGGEEE